MIKQVWFGFMLLSGAVDAANNNYYLSNEGEQPLRGAFTTSDKMYGEVGIQSAQKANARQGFVPGYGAQSIPIMRLKGFVTNRTKKTALLEIEGAGVYMVSKGDEVGLHSIGQNTVLKIIDVGSNGVKVQSGRVNQVIVVR